MAKGVFFRRSGEIPRREGGEVRGGEASDSPFSSLPRDLDYPREIVVGEWHRLCQAEGDSVALSIMVEGVNLNFAESPPPLLTSCPTHLITSGFQEEVLLGFIPDWLQKGYVREFLHPTPLHFSRMFSVPKGPTDRRPIIDLSPLNKLLKKVRFKMEDLGKVARSLTPGL